jgi:hypothetical protein
MKRVLVAIGLLAAVGARPGWAQSADQCMPSALNIPRRNTPVFTPDRRTLVG